MRSRAVFVFVLALGVTARPGTADVWDSAIPSDDSDFSLNQIVHGAAQEHDLAARPGPAADQDWFKVVTEAYSSYEVVVDGATAEFGSGTGGLSLSLSRRALNGTFLGASTNPSSAFGGSFGAYALNLAWENATAVADSNHLVVSSAGCTTSCTASARYTLRFYETTSAIPRFNNSSTQISVLIVQSVTSYQPINGTAWFWAPGGALLGSQGFTVQPHGLFVVNTSTVPGLTGQSGSITITHNGRYGDLGGKAVAIEPATGFSFDSPLAPRAN